MFGFNFMFNFIPVIIGIAFIGFVFFFFIIITKGIVQWNSNNNSPLLTVEAKITSKRIAVRGGMNNTSASTAYYATFEVESGDRMELGVPARDYGMIAEGDFGMLTFQGTRYKGFTRYK